MKVHSFYVEDAEKHGVEKAVILYNLRFWLEKNKANNSNLHDGHYWTFNSAKAFTVLFPYYTASKVERLLRQMEKDGLILSGVYNKKGYDRTKWYSMPEFKAETLDVTQSSNLKNGSCKSEVSQSSNLKNGSCKSEAPIPDINTDHKPDINTDTNASVDNDSSWIDESFEKFYKSYPNKKGKGQAEKTWNNVFTGKGSHKKPSNPFDLFETIMNAVKAQTPIILASEPRYRKHPSTWLNAKAWLDEVDQPSVNHQSSNQNTYQGNNHANHQPANSQHQPKQSSADIYAEKLAEQRRQRDEAANAAATGCDRANIYDMEETF